MQAYNCGPRMTGQASMGAGSVDPSSDYAKYDDIQQYSNSNSSEGYSSYVPSESSYVSCLSTGTPLLDQLRRDGSGSGSDPSVAVPASQQQQLAGARDSISTVVTGHSSSGSSSSHETLRWHGSYSDLSSVTGSASCKSRPAPPPDASCSSSSSTFSSSPSFSSSSSSAAAGTLADPAALVVHSAKVQPPQRHNSESVLYYEQHHMSSGHKTINRQVSEPIIRIVA